MTSLRASIATLQQFPPRTTLNVGDVYRFLNMDRPVSLNAMIAKIHEVTDSVSFHSTIVTDAALGGEVSITLHRDGSYRFSGFMRATGIPSFSFRVGAVIRSGTGQVTVAAQHTGKVFGTDTPGDRQNDWSENGISPIETDLIRALWPEISSGSLAVSRSSELSGVLGTAIDVVKDVAEFLLVAETLGANLAICLVIGSELGNLGVDVPGFGGVIGIGIVGGALFIWGPLAIGPAFILGVAAGAIVDSLIKIRRLEQFERDFASQVFGDSVDFDRIRVTNFVGAGDRPFTIPTVDNHILLNVGVSDEMFDSPTTSHTAHYATDGQLLIHELTHAWQIQHRTLKSGYVPGWLCEAIDEQVVVGHRAYRYGAAGPPWDSFHIEAQAAIVDEWFAGTGKQAVQKLSPGVTSNQMNPNSDYFGYINDVIRAAVL